MKVLIADDEAKTRNGLKQGIDWAALGVERVFLAADGQEAYEIFLRFMPELIITDIRMPGLDGIALARQVREKSRAVKILLLSAYSEFDDARNALHLGVNGYELKPVKLSRLIESVKKCQEELEQEKAQYRQEKEQEEARKRAFLIDALNGTIQDQDLLCRNFRTLFQFRLTDEVMVIHVELDGYHTLSQSLKEAEKNNLYEKLIRFTLTSLWDLSPLLYSLQEGRFVLLITPPQAGLYREGVEKRLTDFHQALSREATHLASVTISMGVSTRNGGANLRDKARQALQALQQKIYTDPGVFHLFTHTEDNWQQGEMVWPDDTGLAEAIRSNNLTSVISLVSTFFQALKREHCTDVEYIRQSCIHLQRLLLKGLQEKGLPARAFLAHHPELAYLEAYETLDEYQHWLVNLYTETLTQLVGVTHLKYSPTIVKALEYIREHFQRDLSVEMVAEAIGKSPNYFSHCFNKEVGISFREYVNKMRIDAAKKLLRETTLKGYEVAQQVGFQEYAYFVQVFRKMEGQAPSDYRYLGRTSSLPESSLQ